MKQALVIVAQEGFQDHEYAGTRSALEGAGFDIVVASQSVGECRGKLGTVEQAHIPFSDVVVSDYDCIAFIGGPGALALASDPEALRIAHETAASSRPLGAICIAPVILAKAHVLSGKKATVWDSDGEQAAILEQYGAAFTGDRVTVDGQIVTANGPEAAEEFGRTFAAL